jgi:hypothetical protein
MRKPAKTFEDLLVWQKAHLYALAVYLRTACKTPPSHKEREHTC